MEQKEYYPHIKIFDEDTIRQIDLPKPIPIDLYDELFKKGIIPKKDLVFGKYYFGRCRNSKVARWEGNEFTYMRIKFSWTFPEKINHLEDDDGSDLFVPLYEVKPEERYIIKDSHALKK